MVPFYLLVGVVLLYFGAEWLVKGSANLALRFGVPSLVVGLTVVAFGTSAPEMVVSIKTGLAGQGGIAIGNVVGSNIFNIAVILGLASFISPLKVNVQVLRIDTPIMVAVSASLFLILHDSVISRLEAAMLFSALILYTSLTIYFGKKSQQQMPKIEQESLNRPVSGSMGLDFLLIGLGLLALIAGSNLFVKGAVALATSLNVSSTIIGLTIVAAGTSLPELATSIVAATQKQEDIAIGNVIGSNIFNIMAILGVSGLLKPLNAQGISHIDLFFTLGTALLLLPMMRTRFTLGRSEGVILLLVYGFYLWILWP